MKLILIAVCLLLMGALGYAMHANGVLRGERDVAIRFALTAETDRQAMTAAWTRCRKTGQCQREWASCGW